MNKTKVYTTRFVLLMFCVLIAYLGLVFSDLFIFDKQNALIISLGNMGIFLLGALIIAPGLNKSHENFILRFLVLTTVQLLTVFGITAALAFMKVTGGKVIGFHFAGLFFVLLVIQTILLVKLNNYQVSD